MSEHRGRIYKESSGEAPEWWSVDCARCGPIDWDLISHEHAIGTFDDHLTEFREALRCAGDALVGPMDASKAGMDSGVTGSEIGAQRGAGEMEGDA